MPEQSPPEEPGERPVEHEAESDWERRRRLAAVFGDVLPETTSDERSPEPRADEPAGDAWLRAQVPPHHG
jgi:hypothetical protein